MQGKQAKIVSPTQERAILGYLATTRYRVVYGYGTDNSRVGECGTIVSFHPP